MWDTAKHFVSFRSAVNAAFYVLFAFLSNGSKTVPTLQTLCIRDHWQHSLQGAIFGSQQAQPHAQQQHVHIPGGQEQLHDRLHHEKQLREQAQQPELARVLHVSSSSCLVISDEVRWCDFWCPCFWTLCMDAADVRHMLISREGSVWNVMDVEPTMPHWRTGGIIAFVIRTTTKPLQSLQYTHHYIPLHTTTIYLWDTLGRHVLTRSDCRNWSVWQQSSMLRSVLPKDVVWKGQIWDMLR